MHSFTIPLLSLLLLSHSGRATESVAPSATASLEVGTLEILPAGAGPVKVTGPGGQRTVSSGGAVLVGDQLTLAANQSALLRLKDESEIVIAPDSVFQVMSFSKDAGGKSAELQILSGLAHFAVRTGYTAKKPFLVRTASATLGVRGTEFVVEHGPTGSTLYTLDGSVALAKTAAELGIPRSSVVVSAGQSSEMKAGMNSPSEPKPFDPKTVKAYLSRRAAAVSERMEHHDKLRREDLRESAKEERALKRSERARPRRKQ